MDKAKYRAGREGEFRGNEPLLKETSLTVQDSVFLFYVALFFIGNTISCNKRRGKMKVQG